VIEVHVNQLQHYVFRYFQATNSHILETSPGHLRVKLSEMADKDLTNRPLYWSFVERMGQTPQTMTLTFIFDRQQTPEGVEGEDLRFGTPRMAQIFSSAAKHGQWTRLYEEADSERSDRQPLSYVPWLCLNCKVQYICDRKKDEIHSLGVNLITGAIKERFIHDLQKRQLTPRIPPRVHTLPANISLETAIQQLERWLNRHVRSQDTAWADDARLRMEEEMARLKQYYENKNASGTGNVQPDNPAQATAPEAIEQACQKQLDEVKWQYEPRIQIDLINAGLFYLSPQQQ